VGKTRPLQALVLSYDPAVAPYPEGDADLGGSRQETTQED